ncbi:YlmC/YmxH family sporulation protein [Mycoplasmatota bacterium WC44]
MKNINSSTISYTELISLDVINVVDGSILGCIDDIKIDKTSGRILTITVSSSSKLWSLNKKHKGFVIPWNQIIKIGPDVIVVNHNCIIY